MAVSFRGVLKVDDLVLVSSIHSDKPYFYQVSSIDWYDNCFVSQPAGFRHPFSSIVAIFRFNGDGFIRVYSSAYDKNTGLS